MWKLSPRQSRLAYSALWYAGGAVLTAITLFPFFWMILTSFKGMPEIIVKQPIWIPQHPTLDNYWYAFETVKWYRYFENSIIVAFFVTSISVLVSTFGGYALSRFEFPGKNTFSIWLLVVYMMPASFMAFPLYIIFSRMGLTNTYISVILAQMTLILPFTIWMLKGYFGSISTDLEEAGMVDGCTRPMAVLRIVLPIALPGLAASAAFAFIESWQNYLYALVMISNDELRTLPLGAASFMGWAGLQWGKIMAYSVMTVLPAIVFFGFLQRYLIQGLTAGAVKE